jgi:hypothetical protein
MALVSLLNYWKTNATVQSCVAASQGTNCLQVSFIRRPAEAGVTYHVQSSTNFAAWSDIASYAGTNIMLTAQAAEVSRSGSPNETVTIRYTAPVGTQPRRFLRLNVTRP